jgi:hypothetical protein
MSTPSIPSTSTHHGVEVGHNLDLAHSGVDKDEYADQTGFMGYANGLDDEIMLFNQQNNYLLGWYADNKGQNNQPRRLGGTREFTLNGISDYEKDKDALVVLRMNNYYVDFDRCSQREW